MTIEARFFAPDMERDALSVAFWAEQCGQPDILALAMTMDDSLFAMPYHAEILRAMRTVYDRCGGCTPSLVRDQLRQCESFDSHDALTVLADVVTAGGLCHRFLAYTQRLRELAEARAEWRRTDEARTALLEGLRTAPAL